jgi:hypothetical protein
VEGSGPDTSINLVVEKVSIRSDDGDEAVLCRKRRTVLNPNVSCESKLKMNVGTIHTFFIIVGRLVMSGEAE